MIDLESAVFLEVSAEVRYWEDASVDGVEDTNGMLIPYRHGNEWKPIIRLSDGIVMGWPELIQADIHYKVCDQGHYWLQDKDGARIAKWRSDYVPDDFLCVGESGYGDYMIFLILEGGKIHEWKMPRISQDEWDILKS